MAEMDELFDKLDKHWDELGFFGLLRDRQLNFDLGRQVLSILNAIDFDELDCIPKKYVSLLWFIPIFMEWQNQRLADFAESSVIHDYRILQNTIDGEIQRILGIP